MLCDLLFLAKPFVASFLPHFLSFDCCLVTFSQKFCLLSGRVKRHSLHSLLSHLAHAVASTVELFNSTGFLTHIMIFFYSIIIFQFASLEYPLSERTPLTWSRGTVCGLQPPESHVPSTATEGEVHPTSLWGSGIPPVLTHRLLPPTQKIELFG